jgi:hypothetical protein
VFVDYLSQNRLNKLRFILNRPFLLIDDADIVDLLRPEKLVKTLRQNYQGYYKTGWFNPEMLSRAAF